MHGLWISRRHQGLPATLLSSESGLQPGCWSLYISASPWPVFYTDPEGVSQISPGRKPRDNAKEKKERCKRETDGRTPIGAMRIAGDTLGVETSSLFHPFRVPTHGMTKSPGLTPWAGLLDPFGVRSGLKPGPTWDHGRSQPGHESSPGESKLLYTPPRTRMLAQKSP